MTQMPPPLDDLAPTSSTAPHKSGLGKLACVVTLIAGVGLIAAVEESLGQVAFSGSLALWGIGFLLTIASFIGHRRRGWAVLALLFNLGIAAWFVMSMDG